MAEDESSNFYNQKHLINITLASQMSLRYILDKIIDLSITYPIDTPEKQKCHLELVKQFVISSIPYIDSKDGEAYMKEVLNFKIKRNSDVKRGIQKFSYTFDPQLDFRLNKMLAELQNKLRPILTKIIDDSHGDPYN